jgi:hypothetical protein
MTVDTSITERLPFPLTSGRGSVSSFQLDGITPDITIDGMPFFLAITDETPYVRQTADARRQQIDTSREPGEQTLSQWWVRDQDSWHRGAGINYYEPGTDAKTQYRFASGYGVNPWVQGELSLHRKMDSQISSAGSCYATGAVVAGNDAIFVNVNGSLRRVDTATTTYTGTGTPATVPVVAGTKVLVGSTVGILSGDTTGSTFAALWTTTSGLLIQPWWAKSRIIASKGAELHDLTLVGGNIDTATPLWTHPVAGWTWTSVAEAPGAILAAGYVSGYGYIYKFDLKDNGTATTPVLGAATQVAEFPPGEEIHAMRVYLASYVAIGTSKGVRIGLLDTDGKIAYGPINIATTKPVRAFSARDTYIYAGIEADINGNSGAARIDLSEPISDLRFAWAYDVQVVTTAAVQSVTFWGLTDRVVLGLSGLGIYRQSTTQYETSGTVTSGWIRYGTSEPKLFSRVKVRTDLPDTSTLTISTIDGNGGTQTVITLGAGFNTDEDVTLQSIADLAQPYARITLRLTAGTGQASTPRLQSFQVKATPTPTIQRELRIPLRLMDFEQDRQNVKIGHSGWAYERLVELEDIEQSRGIVIVKDWTTGETFAAQIRNVQVIRSTPPARNLPNFGGLVYLTVLKL